MTAQPRVRSLRPAPAPQGRSRPAPRQARPLGRAPLMSGVSPWLGLMSAGFAVAGLLKVTDTAAATRLFRRWGWSDENRRLIGTAELVGAALVCVRPTRRLGGAVLSTSSAVVLASELAHGEGPVGLPRLAMLIAAMTAL